MEEEAEEAERTDVQLASRLPSQAASPVSEAEKAALDWIEGRKRQT